MAAVLGHPADPADHRPVFVHGYPADAVGAERGAHRGASGLQIGPAAGPVLRESRHQDARDLLAGHRIFDGECAYLHSYVPGAHVM